MAAHSPSGDDPTAFRPADDDGSLPEQLTPGTVIGERYRIVSLIGRGGMGEVYRADDLKLGQAVALKFRGRQGHAARLYEEVRIGRQISHPNVCRLYDIAEIDGHLFITMEFVDGEDLASLLRRVGRLPSEKALAVTRDMCAGLAAAHEKGVIHRDLKPANVMIDGRGRARVTDFGLAVAADAATDGAGTPAYMAPEQLAGESASVKSDIYALGLVVYEVFTGRRTFEPSSALDLLARQKRGEFTRPSLVTKDVPAAVERVIARCLDANPAARPESVEEIMRELPGGDPLAAAIAAGETPSPAMVAAAADRGELPAAAAWSCLAIFTAILFLYAALTSRTMLYRIVTVKSPEVLEERVQEVLAATQQTLPRADWSSVFATDVQRVQQRQGAAAVPPILYAHRQSPRSMAAQGYEHLVTANDPPFIYSGMANVLLESDGRLRHFAVVPPQLEHRPEILPDVDWQPFLRFSAVRGPLQPVRPEWAAVVDSDEKRAWTAPDGTRIEVASYHGKPVWFDVVKPSAAPWRMEQRTETGSRISTAAVLITIIGFWTAALMLALRNMRRGQGDRRGAWRVAAVLTGTSFVAVFLLAHHVTNAWDETTALTVMAGLALFIGAETWIGYVAVEPLVRRRWPHMLISATRLIAGRVRDPMVGRDLLLGATSGLGVVFLRELTALLPGAVPFQSANLALSGIRYVGWFAAASIVVAILGPIVWATLLVAVQAVTRNVHATVLLVALLAGSTFVGDVAGPIWTRAIFGLIGSTVILLLLFRFGLFAYSAGVFAYVFLRRMPITLDPTAWYFGRSTVALAILMIIAVYGFSTSLGGKKWLPDLAIDG